MIPNILIVEDDLEIGNLILRYLKQSDFNVSLTGEARAMDKILAETRVDLIILDLMLPGEDGLSICRRLRASSDVPIIMLTAQKDDIERIVGLEMGADDYITKPFNPRELLARIRAILRRAENNSVREKTLKTRIYRFAGWQFDTALRRLFDPNSSRVVLTGAELDLLLVFCERPGRVLSRDTLIELSRGRQANPTERSVDILISRLRQKIEACPKDPTFLQTVRSGGYLFSPDVLAE